MFFSTLATLSLVVASVVASPTRVIEARASNPTIYMRIEGPTKTLYEKTIVASPKVSLTNSGHTAKCDGLKSTPGVTALVALQQTGQYFESQWNGTEFQYITKLNNTENKEYSGPDNAWGAWGTIVNYAAASPTGGIVLLGEDDFSDPELAICAFVIPDQQHMLYAYFGDIDETGFMIMSGPKTAKVGQTVQYKVPYAYPGAYVNDLSVDTTTGQTVYAKFGDNTDENSAVSIKFTKKGTYNMKAHCPANAACVRSNHVVTVVS